MTSEANLDENGKLWREKCADRDRQIAELEKKLTELKEVEVCCCWTHSDTNKMLMLERFTDFCLLMSHVCRSFICNFRRKTAVFTLVLLYSLSQPQI